MHKVSYGAGLTIIFCGISQHAMMAVAPLQALLLKICLYAVCAGRRAGVADNNWQTGGEPGQGAETRALGQVQSFRLASGLYGQYMK